MAEAMEGCRVAPVDMRRGATPPVAQGRRIARVILQERNRDPRAIAQMSVTVGAGIAADCSGHGTRTREEWQARTGLPHRYSVLIRQNGRLAFVRMEEEGCGGWS